MAESKPKRDLLIALNHIERFHHRRMVLTMHVVLSLAIQFAIWANWYTSFAVRGDGFRGTFFSDRVTISVTLGLFLLGHYFVVRLLERKDRTVVKAIQQYDAEDDIIASHYDRLIDHDAQLVDEHAESHTQRQSMTRN
ncbi:MAG: hypothetical protein CL607_12065 [Anaerolineaceae bacterium]|nr:hypothetical protein [Anaerolineaceae bacterium]